MLTANMSLRGLYEYDSTIFDLLILPTGIDPDILRGVILFAAGAREVLYPNPNVIKSAIGYWAASNQKTWEKLLYTVNVEYDPIANYDRTETWTDTRGSTRGATQTTTSTSENQSNTSGSGTAATVEQNKAYNDVTFSDSRKSTVTSNDTNTTTGNDSSTVNGTVEETLNENVTREGRAVGNIGVTTTQQMLESEREVAKFNIYEHIAAEFCYRFLLGVY